MSLPPQPGSWQPPQQAPGAPGQQPQGPSYGPPSTGYQQPWHSQSGPPKKGGNTKWVLLGGLALVAVIAIAVAVTAVVLQPKSDGVPKGSITSSSGAASGIASANDDGPVTIITADPSCATWTPTINTLADRTTKTGWDKRDASVPATAWSAEQRAEYQDATAAMLSAADQTVTLAKLTPHRVMRELYEQLIAYWHAYADSIDTYTPIDDNLAQLTTTATDALTAICDAITHGSAAARAPLVPSPKPPTQTAPPGDPAKPARFLTTGNPICSDWDHQADTFNSATADWQKTDGNIPASQWSAQDKVLNDAFVPAMNTFVDKTEQLGRSSGNPTLEDFAVLAAQYGAAFVKSFPTYVGSDQYLYTAAVHSTSIVGAACKAVRS